MLTRLPRYLARTCAIAATLVALLVVSSPASAAGPPTILSAGQVQHHATVAWALPAGSVTRSVEVSDSPTVASDGAFFSDHVRSVGFGQRGADDLHLDGRPRPGHLLRPRRGLRAAVRYVPDVRMVRDRAAHRPAGVQPVVEGSGQVTGPGGLSCTGASAPSPTPRGPRRARRRARGRLSGARVVGRGHRRAATRAASRSERAR